LQLAVGHRLEGTEILRRFIFGDVFDTGVLDDQTRELITVAAGTEAYLRCHIRSDINLLRARGWATVGEADQGNHQGVSLG
jgi:hypothetical protein